MIVQIETRGGFAGIPAAARPRRIEIPDAPASADLARAFHPDHLARIERGACRTGSDRVSYLITVTDANRRDHCFTLSEGQLPPDMLDLIDRL